MVRDNIRFPKKPPWLQLDRDPKEADRQRLLCVAVRRSRVRTTMVDTWEGNVRSLEEVAGAGRWAGARQEDRPSVRSHLYLHAWS